MDTLLLAQAQITPTMNSKTIQEYFPPARFVNIASFINFMIPAMFFVAGTALLVVLFRGAFLILTSGGNPENTAKGKNTIVYALLGFLFIVFSFVIVKVIGYVFNVDLLF